MKQTGYAEKQRIAWVDILRFLGMTLIYWGHLGPSENVTLYIFSHHVPLFFLISGFFAWKTPSGKTDSFGRFLWNKIRSIVFPYLFFTLLFYVLQLITGQLSLSALPAALLVSAKGIRNEVPGPLWFFTCLFLVCVVYELLRRILSSFRRNETACKVILTAICALLYLVGIFCLGHEPAQDPAWIWNADSAFLYVFYYALGALFFPLLRDFRYPKAKTAGKVCFFLFFGLSVLFGIFTLISGAAFTSQVSVFLQETCGNVYPLAGGTAGRVPALASVSLADALFEIYALLSALILIFMEICFARMLNRIPGIGRFLSFSGKSSLYHCGNELIIKYFGGLLLSVLGLTRFLSNDLGSLLYSLLCLLVLTLTLNPLERFLLGKLFRSR